MRIRIGAVAPIAGLSDEQLRRGNFDLYRCPLGEAFDKRQKEFEDVGILKMRRLCFRMRKID
jgi:hypothetical protein